MCVDHICKSSEYIFKAPEKLKKKKWRSVHLQGAFLMNMKPSVKKIELQKANKKNIPRQPMIRSMFIESVSFENIINISYIYIYIYIQSYNSFLHASGVIRHTHRINLWYIHLQLVDCLMVIVSKCTVHESYRILHFKMHTHYEYVRGSNQVCILLSTKKSGVSWPKNHRQLHQFMD